MLYAIILYKQVTESTLQERIFVYNCNNMEIYSLFDISAIVFHCTFR